MKLVKLEKKYQTQLQDMLKEWTDYNKSHYTNHSPWAIFRLNYLDFDNYLENLELKEEKDGRVPDSTFFLLDEERDIFVGAVNIRHYLNEELAKGGGHIGDGIRPSERKKGYGTLILKLALEECKKLGIDRVMIACNKSNIGSMKAIIKNKGVFDREIEENGEVDYCFWIDVK